MFGAIIGVTMYVTYLAAKRVKSAADFYTAGGGVSGLQNGWAIAGDYLSAASFLGIAGLISLYGYDGFMYSVGWLVAYITVLLVIAEPCRNIGKYTLSDILAYRNNPRATRIVGALSVITVSTFYLTAQMVGGGVLVKTLIGIDYEVSVIVVGVLMLAYVLFGGMVATTWVQIIKAILLVTASIVLVMFVWTPYGFSLPAFLSDVVGDPKVQAQVALLLGDASQHDDARATRPALPRARPLFQGADRPDLARHGARVRHGRPAAHPDAILHGPDGQEARKSVIWAMAIIGGFYVLTLFLGIGAAINVGAANIKAVDAGGNMAAPLLAQYLGGGADSLLGNLFLAFVSAVAFATIVAVVAGLVLAAASAIAHDLYVGVIRGDEDVPPQEQVKAARIATVVGRRAGDRHRHRGQGPERRASRRAGVRGGRVGQFPVRAADALLAALQHRRHRARHDRRHADRDRSRAGVAEHDVSEGGQGDGAEGRRRRAGARGEAYRRSRRRGRRCGEGAGCTRRIAGVAQGRHGRQGEPRASSRARKRRIVGLEKPLFELRNPGLMSIPLGFLAVIIGSLLYRDRRADDMWDELYARQNTGILAAKAAAH